MAGQPLLECYSKRWAIKQLQAFIDLSNCVVLLILWLISVQKENYFLVLPTKIFLPFREYNRLLIINTALALSGEIILLCDSIISVFNICSHTTMTYCRLSSLCVRVFCFFTTNDFSLKECIITSKKRTKSCKNVHMQKMKGEGVDIQYIDRWS